jgi:hypothetical protein
VLGSHPDCAAESCTELASYRPDLNDSTFWFDDTGTIFADECDFGNPVTDVPDFTSEVQPIFNTRCTSCHYGSSPSAGLDLNVDAWDDIVGVESTSTDFMDIVSADSASSSVLWWKIWGEHDLMGIPGGAMPPIGALSDADILLITHWINAGAPE